MYDDSASATSQKPHGDSCALALVLHKMRFLSSVCEGVEIVFRKIQCVCGYIYYICTYILVINFQENFGPRLCEELENPIQSSVNLINFVHARDIYLACKTLIFILIRQ